MPQRCRMVRTIDNHAPHLDNFEENVETEQHLPYISLFFLGDKKESHTTNRGAMLIMAMNSRFIRVWTIERIVEHHSATIYEVIAVLKRPLDLGART